MKRGIVKRILLVADLHLTDLPKDEYRWKIFPWLKEKIKEHSVQRLIILGDLTDKKDKHSSKLVNRLSRNLESLLDRTSCEEIIVIKGNHDYVDEDCPFFEFLGSMSNIKFITKPTLMKVHSKSIYYDLFLPHTKNPAEDWGNGFKELWKLSNGTYLDASENNFRYIFMHQTVSGSIFANGFKFENDSAKKYNDILNKEEALVYSGDVHVPQEVGSITYVGSPYSIKYGDHWIGRAILLKDEKEIELPYNSLIKWCIDIKDIKGLKRFISANIDEDSFDTRDLAKVRIHLNREDYHLYKDLKEKAKKILQDLNIETTVEMKSIKKVMNKKITLNIQDTNLNPKDIMKKFGDRENLDTNCLNIGINMLEE